MWDFWPHPSLVYNLQTQWPCLVFHYLLLLLQEPWLCAPSSALVSLSDSDQISFPLFHQNLCFLSLLGLTLPYHPLPLPKVISCFGVCLQMVLNCHMTCCPEPWIVFKCGEFVYFQGQLWRKMLEYYWSLHCLFSVCMTDELGTLSIGFLGLGIMGSPMAQNLLKAGYKFLTFICLNNMIHINFATSPLLLCIDYTFLLWSSGAWFLGVMWLYGIELRANATLSSD